MKNIILTALLLTAGMVSAQNIKPSHEIENQIIKSTYYYDNGAVRQSGFYKDGRLHGSWVAYNQDGTKQSMGEYANGVKTGKWFFWTGSVLNEVDYNNSRIADIKKWSKDAVAINK
jgi:antitoxin component YwqK of YwqJK toxin-antitoxin module